jgi:MarR family protein
MSLRSDWYLLSHHGAVLFYIATRPGCTIREMADALSVTPRTVWSLLTKLRRAGMLEVELRGHRHHYSVNLAALFEVPNVGEFPLNILLGALAEHSPPRLALSVSNGVAIVS